MTDGSVCVVTSVFFFKCIVQLVLECFTWCFKFKTKPGCYELAAFSRNMAGFQIKERKLCKQEIHRQSRRFGVV